MARHTGCPRGVFFRRLPVETERGFPFLQLSVKGDPSAEPPSAPPGIHRSIGMNRRRVKSTMGADDL